MTSASPIDTLAGAAAASAHGSLSPRQPVKPKHVQFELMFPESPQYRARLPLRVQIYPHDSTESIVTTVKNFYGLYPGPATSKGVSFEDDRGNTLIARYENFSNNMVVYVRVFEEAVQPAVPFGTAPYHPGSTAGAPPYMSNEFGPPLSQQYEPSHKPASHGTSRRRSISPDSANGRRSESVSNGQPGPKKARSKSSRAPGSDCEHGGYSSGDGASGSVSSKFKDQMGNTDISLENIVEGGRRKRAKFESSELPLFAPPQMPAATSNSSVSPARRIEHQRPSIPFAHPGQHPFAHPRPLQSPQSYTNPYGAVGAFATPVHDSRRHRGSISYGSGSGIMPTPEPTVGSAMSEEDKDVAMQLMRLGDMSNISHGRTSASTLDDTFSGKADATSSTGATSDSDSDGDESLHAARRQKLDFTGANRKVYHTDSHFVPSRDNQDVSGDDADYEDSKSSAQIMGKPRLPSSKMSKPKTSKAPKPGSSTKVKKPSTGAPSGPMSPNSLPTQSRKPSVASTLAGLAGEDDQPDLSSKPRCQRCRKSKKGCDRQRPCGRCRDAGLGADQCVSEDEGNGRKGRYGRHMGVPVKTTGELVGPPALLPAAPIAPIPILANDKNKKRKR
ncbi:hypothetical protein Micbo1qcDRAFT_53014 [Microdochium bolleyi]|uniref:Zn(2)-C6 fungal-type domain-containing protein n=1 Tax=Microdochium bolleyi TaxID=196109 RepID=A0A136J7C2_9PEZI|nr:hypothetical protein Micbo1qcDRAFT_53014 [Microdochium bolleyi]